MRDFDGDRLIVGIDAGGTSTRATLLTRDGQCLGYGKSGSGNPTSAGMQLAGESIVDAMSLALGAAGREIGEVDHVVAAMAGHGAGGDVRWLIDTLAVAGYDGALGFESDLLALYFSGTAEQKGYAIVSGTGAAVVRVSGGRLEATSDGVGWLLGDRGSGFWIGHHAALAAVEDLDGRGPATALTEAVLDALQVVPSDFSLGYGRPAKLEALVRTIYLGRPVELARLAPLVFAAADADEIARGILLRAGELLAQTFASVHRGSGPVVVGGSVLAQEGLLSEIFRRLVLDREPQARFIPVADGVVGAAALALRHAGVVVDGEGHARLTASVAAARAR
ncbi:N-acetylglucosamine kinase [Microbacterium sp. NPDC057659]|uniref:N-acetylglucosamine kinase n=1 Tax=Microbacterium sp. NPDC057659 TaxID=3346198 RepID=UPI00366A7A06